MFRLKKIIGGRINQAEPEKIDTVASNAYSYGQALTKGTGGGYVKCTDDSKPEYISLETYTAPASGNRQILAYRILPSMIFEVEITGKVSTVKQGTRLEFGTDGLDACAAETVSTTGHIFVADKNGATAENDTVLVTIE